jgi:aspartate oxidase
MALPALMLPIALAAMAASSSLAKPATVSRHRLMPRGGIAAALGPSDDWHKHYDDTLHVARGLAFTQAVEVLVQSGPAGIMAMQNDGLAFDMRKGHFYLGREAGAFGKTNSAKWWNSDRQVGNGFLSPQSRTNEEYPHS